MGIFYANNPNWVFANIATVTTTTSQ